MKSEIEVKRIRTWLDRIGGAEFKVMRLNDANAQNKTTDTPEGIVEYLRERLASSIAYRSDTESFMVVHLSTRRKPIGFEVVSNGTMDTLLVHPREVFRSAVVMGASALVLAHNHPSGDPTPSEADIKVTRDLIRAGQLMKIEVLDHVILGTATADRPRPFVSMRELGYFYT